MKIFGWLSLFFCASAFSATAPIVAKNKEQASDKGYVLLDKVCVIVEGEEPILFSEIKNRSEQRQETFADAQKELTRDRLLWVYAKKQLKYDIAGFYKATDEHIENIMAKNNLTPKQFEDVLLEPPYKTTTKKFRFDTATEYLKNTVKQTISAQIAVTDEQIKSELRKKFDVVFIAVKSASSTRKASASREEIKKANAIRAKIKHGTTVNDIKKLYGKDKRVSIIGPIAYEKDVLRKEDDERLQKDETATVIGPFNDDGALTMIWKIKKSKKNLDESALEKLRKESYHNSVLEKFNALTDSLINSSTVIEKSCGKQIAR